MGKAFAQRPFSQIGVIPFARCHKWRHHADALTFEITHDARHDLIGTLRLYTHLTSWAHLRAELHVH